MSGCLLFGMAFITFLNRYAFFASVFSYTPGEKFRKFLGYSSFSVLTAIWAPIMFSVDAQSGFNYAGPDYLAAAVIAALMSFLKIRSILVVIVSASIFFGLRFIVL